MCADDEHDQSAASRAADAEKRRHVPLSDTGPDDVTRPAMDVGKADVEDDVVND